MRTSLFLWLLVLCGVAAASDYWQGTVQTPSGAIPIGIDVDGKNATLYAPALGLVDKPISMIHLAEHRLFELHFDDRVITADLLENGNSLAGATQVGSQKYPVALHRGPRPEKNYRTEEVAIRSGDATLAGTLYLPKGGEALPGLAFVAGLGPRGDGIHFLADQFANRGIAALTYDRRAGRVSFSTQADDAAAAVRYLRSRKEIDPSRVGIRGQSQGAWIAPLAASRVPVAFVIATGGGGVQPWQSESYAIPARMRADGFSDAEIAEAGRYMEKLFAVGRSGEGWSELSAMMEDLRRRGSRWFGKYGSTPPSFDDLRQVWEGDFSYDPVPALRKLTVPVLALEGEKDVYSPPVETIRALEKSLTAAEKTLRIIPNATHDFHILGAPLPLVSDEYLATIANWTMAQVGDNAERKIVDHRIVSNDPKLAIDVDPTLKFVGTFAADIRDAAHYQRIIFADSDVAGTIRRLWIAQFERLLPSHPGSYEAKMRNPVRIGSWTFDQQVGAYSFTRSIASKPGGEAEKTRQFLLERGLRVGDDLTVARFETRTDPQNRSELIIFYWVSGPPLESFAEKAKTTFAIQAP